MSRPDEWNEEECAREQARLMFRGYTADEINRIIEAIRSAGFPVEGADLRDRLMFVTLRELDIGDFDWDSLIKEAKAIYDAVTTLDVLLKHRIDEGDLCDGRWKRDFYGKQYEKASSYLYRIAEQAVRDCKRHEEYKKIVPKGRKMIVQNQKLSAIARLWENLGGRVTYEREYREFCEAVALPLFRSTYGRAHGLHWNDENTVRDHVKKWIQGGYDCQKQEARQKGT